MSSYIMRRQTDEGYKWYIMTPTTVNGKVKRGTDKCLGTTEEAEEYLKSIKNTKYGKELYAKFRSSVEDMKKVLKKKRKPERYLIKSQYGYFGGMTNSFDNPIKWVKDPKWARKLNEKDCVDTITGLNVIYGYSEIPLETISESTIIKDNNRIS